MSRHTGRRALMAYGFPRVSGDEPDPASAPQSRILFSPRERG